MIITKKRNKIIELILLTCIVLTGCGREPDLEALGLRAETEVQIFAEPAPDIASGAGEGDSREQQDLAGADEGDELTVFVCGAVERPGVYRLRDGSRIYEALEAAGGFGKDADREWLNLAQPLQDGQKLTVLTRQEAAGQSAVSAEDSFGSAQAKEPDGRINLNTATREQLMTLPGIGETKADAIISYRSDHGAFRSIEEIMEISGIKNAVFLKIRDRIIV